jgi:imidazolonepropionase-like amidohydrolase
MARSRLRKVVRGLLITLVTTVMLGAASWGYFYSWPLRTPHPVIRLATGSLVIPGARVYVSPDAPVQDGVDVVITEGRIAAIGKGVARPAGARVLPCDGCTVAAGFWNAHVHFTEAKWAADTSAASWNASLADMTTSRGFTTVVDVGSDLRTTVSLRRRIESGELAGPQIYTAGGALYPPEGVPFYIRDDLPPLVLKYFIAQPRNPAQAIAATESNIDRGADVLKLFTGSYVEREVIKPMPVDIAKAAVDVAHRHGQLVFAHPSNLVGMQVAMDSGVDVLAHAADDDAEKVDDAILARVVALHMSMVPTLKMFATTVTTKASYIAPIHDEVRRFHRLGGDILFGTDVGYMKDYTTEDEMSALADAGLSARDVLRTLTVAPATRFHVTADKGTVEVGKMADLVILDADPEKDLSTLAHPRTTIRGGKVLFER